MFLLIGSLQDLWDRHKVPMFVLGVLVLYLGLFGYAGAKASLAALAKFDIRSITLILALVTVGYIVRFLRWNHYFRSLHLNTGLRYQALSFFSGLMMTITPMKAGDLWKAWFVQSVDDTPAGLVVPIVIAERVLDFVALTVFAALSLLYFYSINPTMILSAGIILVVVSLLSLISSRQAAAVGQRVPFVRNYMSKMTELSELMRVLFSPRTVAIALPLSLTAWFFEICALKLVFDVLSVDMGIATAMFVFSVGSIVGVLSLLPGGAIATETSMVGVLMVLGVARSAAVTSTVVIRGATLWYGTIVGVLIYTTYKLVQYRVGRKRLP